VVSEDDAKILRTKGFLEIKMPTCLGDQPAFRRRLDHIRNLFSGRVCEEEIHVRDRIVVHFTLID
jgi:hypothetical protein